MSTKHIWVWIIWTGSISDDCHAPAVKAMWETELVAVLSRNEDTWKDFMKKHAWVDWWAYTSIDDFLLDDKIDLVIICSPDKLHYEQARKCLNAWKHVLLEKPFTTNLDDALDLEKISKEKNLILSTSYHLRSHIGHKKLYDKIVNWSEIWTIRYMRVIWAFPQIDDSNWRAKNDFWKWWSLAAVWTHCIDFTRWFSKNTSDWESFSSVINKNKWKGIHDETAVISGITSLWISVEVTSSVQFWPYNRVEIFWDDGMAICDWTMWRYWGWKIFINDEELLFDEVSPFVLQLENIVNTINKKDVLNIGTDICVRSIKDLLLADDV